MVARWLSLFSLAVFLFGCANVSSSSEISADGTIVQRVRLSRPKSEMPGNEAPPLADLIKFDQEGGWTSSESGDESTMWIEGVRERGPGSALPMFAVHDKKGVYLKSSCSVERLADGKLVFTETYTWVRENKEPAVKPDPERSAELKEALAKAELSDDQLKAIETELGEAMWRMMFGPSEPLLGLLLTNPAAAEKRFGSLVGAKMLEVVASHVGEKMTRDEIVTAVRGLKSKVAKSSGLNRDEKVAQAATEEEEPNLTGMLVSIKAPGRLVESNGIYDPIENEVFWSFYDMSSQIGPVVLRAVFEP